MSDVVVQIQISNVSYQAWLRTSHIGMAIVGDGVPLIKTTELGTDQEDAFENFIDEASREVLKLYMSRQGDVEGIPFEQTSTDIIYRFLEGEPVLPQAESIKSSLIEDTKNAIYIFITILWLNLKKQNDHIEYLRERYDKVCENIDRQLYKLHD